MNTKARILIVVDKSDMRCYLQRLLSVHYYCLLAKDGCKGHSVAVEQLPDLIIVNMSLRDGLQLIDTLKSSDLTSHIPVILLLTRIDQSGILMGLQHRVDHHLSQPIDTTELYLKVHNLLSLRDNIRSDWAVQVAAVKVGGNKAQGSGVLGLKQQCFINHYMLNVQKHYQDCRLSIETLADEMAITSRQLRRKLKALTGCTPNALLQNYRLEKSLQLLNRLPELTEVAYQVGFYSYNYYGRCFRRRYAMTPGQYREQFITHFHNIGLSSSRWP